MYSVNKVKVFLTVPLIEEKQTWYERVRGWQGYCDIHDADCTFFVKVDDVEEVYARVVESDVALDAPLEAQPWGGRTFSLYDLNGFHLTLYQLEKE